MRPEQVLFGRRGRDPFCRGTQRAQVPPHHLALTHGYMLELVGGQRIFVSNRALRRAAPEVTARLVRGEAVDPAHVYYRCVPSLAIFKVLRAASGSWTDRRRNFHPPAINPALTAATDISIYVPRLVEKNGRNPPEST